MASSSLKVFTDASPVTATTRATGHPASQVKRFISAPEVIADDDIVRARNKLLNLLLTICQNQDQEQLAALSHRYRLQSLMHQVLLEEKRKHRVFLQGLASQVLDLLTRVAPSEFSGDA